MLMPTRAGDTHQGQVWIECRQHLPAEAELLEAAWLEVLDYDVCLRCQAKSQGAPLRRLQIDCNRPLVARLQKPPERRSLMEPSPCTKRISAAWLLDLDDVCAELRKYPSRERRGDESSEFDDSNSG
jgi:hypothetical protein